MTVKAGQKCTAIRRVLVPDRDGRHGRRRARRAAREGHRRQPGPRGRPHGCAREPRPSARRCARPSRHCAAPPSRARRPDPRRPRRGRRRARRLHVPRPAPGPCRRPGAARRRGLRTGQHRADLRLGGRGGHPRRPRQGQPGRLPGHPRPVRRARGRARRRAVARPDPRPRPRRRRGVDRATAARCRCSCTAVRVAPAAARSSGGVRAVLHHMQRTALQGSPDMLTAITGRWTTGSRRQRRGRPPVPQEPRRPARRRHRRDPVPPGHAGGHRATSRSSPATRSTRTPTRRRTAPNPLFGGIVAHGYLVVSLAAGLFVQPDPGSGARELRRRQPPLPHARSRQATPSG